MRRRHRLRGVAVDLRTRHGQLAAHRLGGQGRVGTGYRAGRQVRAVLDQVQRRLVDRLGLVVRCQRDIGQVDRQRRRRQIAVAVLDRVDKHVRRRRRNNVALRRVAVAAIGIERQRAQRRRHRGHPVGHRRGGVAARRADAGDPAGRNRHARPVRAEPIVHTVGQQVTGNRPAFRHRVAVRNRRRRIIVDVDRQVCGCGLAAVRILDIEADVEDCVVLVVPRRMDDRCILGDRIAAGLIVQRDRQDQGRALQDLQHPCRAGRIHAEPGRQAALRRREIEIEIAVAAGPGQSSRRVGGIDIVADAAGIAARQRIVVKLNHCGGVGARCRIGEADGQRRCGGVAVAVAQRVGEHVTGIAARAGGARIGIAAVLVDHQRTVLACDREIARTIRSVIGIRGNIVAGDSRENRSVGTERISAAGGIGGALAGDDVAGGAAASGCDGIGIVAGGGHIVDDIDRQRVVRCGSVEIGEDNGKIFEQVIFAISCAMGFIVEQGVAVANHAGRGVVAGDRDGVAQRRLPAFGHEAAVRDHGVPADHQAGDAIRRRNRERAGRGQRFLGRVRTVGQVVFIDQRVAAVHLRCEIRDDRAGIADRNGERGGRGVGIAIGQGVGEHVADIAGSAGIARVAVIAVRLDCEHAVLAVDYQIAGGIEAGVGIGGNIVAGDARNARPVGARRISAAGRVSCALAADDIASRRAEVASGK